MIYQSQNKRQHLLFFEDIRFIETSSPSKYSSAPPTSEDSTKESRGAENLQVTLLTSFTISENMEAQEKPDCARRSMKRALVFCLCL